MQFIHVRSKHENALPLIITHGWPGSIIEQMKVIGPLDRSDGVRRERVGRVPSRDSVDSGIRLFGRAGRPGLGPVRIAKAWARADAAPRIQ